MFSLWKPFYTRTMIFFHITSMKIFSHNNCEFFFTSYLWKYFHSTSVNFFHITTMKTFLHLNYEFFFTSHLWIFFHITGMIFFHITSMKMFYIISLYIPLSNQLTPKNKVWYQLDVTFLAVHECEACVYSGFLSVSISVTASWSLSIKCASI